MEIYITTSKKEELIDITPQVQDIVKKSGAKNGICHIFVAHATAAIIIHENADPNICVDFLKAMERAVPTRNNYLHDQIDDNAAAHIKAALLGPSEFIPIKNGQLDLGTWQSIMLVELDGPRRQRKIQVTCLEGII